MTDKFRILHSTLIEHYQFIEAHLEGIYAQLYSEDKSLNTLYNGLQEVKRDSINRLIHLIKQLEKEKGFSLLSDFDYERLAYTCTRRNFWCHNCYYDMVFDRRTGEPKKGDMELLQKDLSEAKQLRDELYQLYMKLSQQV